MGSIDSLVHARILKESGNVRVDLNLSIPFL
jgi:hypothetical protein